MYKIIKSVLYASFILSLAGAFNLCYSQVTTGPNNPALAADGGGGGGSTPTWSVASGDPYTSNNTYATIVSQIKNKNTNYLHITNLGFSIPVGSYISGIKVEVEMFGTVPGGATNRENSILLVNSAGTRVGTDHSTAATLATTDPNSYVTYGSSTDNWGGVLTYADVNSSNFGVAIQYQSGSTNNTAGNYNFNVDHVRVTITYSPTFDALIDGCFNDGATWGRVSPGVAGVDYPNATIAAGIPGGRTVIVCAGTTANCFALIVNSTLSNSLGAIVTLANSTSSLNVANNIMMSTTTSASSSFASGTINLNGGVATTQGDLMMTADRNVGNDTSQGIVFGGGTLTVNGTATLSSDNAAATTTLNMTTANSTFNLGGDLSLGLGASVANGSGATGTINYKGSGAQIVRSIITYFNLTYSGGGLKSLEGNTNVKGTLTMTSGNCDMGGLILTLGSSSATASKGTLSYASGTLYNGTFTRWFDNSTVVAEGAATGIFPVGSPSNYRPLYVYFGAAPSTGGTLSVLHDYSTPGVTTGLSIADGVSTITRRTNMFWTLTAANSFNIAINNLNTHIEGTNIGQVGLVTDLRIMRAASVIGTAGTNGGTTTLPIIRRINLPAFTAASNTFYIGSVDGVSSPLPITLVSFKASVVKDIVQLDWSTSAEVNNDLFTVERSSNGEGFSDIGQVKGSGTSTVGHSYKLTDYAPIPGKSYYRLKQTDFDGKFAYSKIIFVTYEGLTSPRVVVYPNPSDGLNINISLSKESLGKTVSVKVHDINGKELLQSSTESLNSIQLKIALPQSFPSGIYIISVAVDQDIFRQRLIVK